MASKPPHQPPTRVSMLEVDPESEGQRLDNFLLRRLKGVPRSHVYRLIRSGQVRVNRGRAKPSRRLASGDQVRVPPVRLSRASTGAVDERSVAWIQERILHEDQRLLVLDKPSGLAVHGGSGISLGLIETLRAARPDSPYLELAHRLDRSTSGIVLVAKRRSALRVLHEFLRTDAIDKHYLALLRGPWDRGTQLIETPLKTTHRRDGERYVVVHPDGRLAVSEFKPVEFFGAQATLMAVQIRTGRTHQIRVQAAAMTHPVAGDERYGDPRFNRAMRQLGLKRLFLHAQSVSFTWPGSEQEQTFSAPLPGELTEVLARLGSG
jgi:23S rRNA pseudouridine955/2504/2580 synthase